MIESINDLIQSLPDLIYILATEECVYFERISDNEVKIVFNVLSSLDCQSEITELNRVTISSEKRIYKTEELSSLLSI